MDDIRYIYEEGEGITYEYKTFQDGDTTTHELWTGSNGVFVPDYRCKLLISITEYNDGLVLPKKGGLTNYAESYYYGLLLMLASGVDFKKIKVLKDA